MFILLQRKNIISKQEIMPHGMSYSHFSNEFCNSSINTQLQTPLLKWGVYIPYRVGQIILQMDIFLTFQQLSLIEEIASADPAFCFSRCHNDFEIADE